MVNDILEIVFELVVKVFLGICCVCVIGVFEVDVFDECELSVFWFMDVVDFRIYGWCEYYW